MTFSTSRSQPQQHRSTTSRWLARTLVAATVLATGAQAVVLATDPQLCISLQTSTTCPSFSASSIDTRVQAYVATYASITMQPFTTVEEFDKSVLNATGFNTDPGCNGYNSSVRIPYQNTVLCAIVTNAVSDNSTLKCPGTNIDTLPTMCTTSCALYQQGLTAMASNHCSTDTTMTGNIQNMATICTKNDPTNWANLHGADNATCISALQNEASTCGRGTLTANTKCAYCLTNPTDTCCGDAATVCATTTSSGPSASSTSITPPTATGTTPATSGKTGLSNGALGGIIGGSVGVVLIALVMFLCVRRSRKSDGGNKSANLSRQISNSSARYNISSPKIQEESFVAATAASIPMTPIAAENAKFGAGAAAIAGAGAVAADGGGKQSYCQALYPYQASMADELDLTPGDIINVQRVFDDGWAVGVNMNTSNEGAFPVVCVMFVDESALDDDFEDVNMHSMTPMTLREEDDGRRSPSGRNSPRSSLPSRSSSPVHLPRRNSSIRDSTVIVPGSSPMMSSPLAGGRMTPPVRDTMLSDASSINRWWDGEK